MIPDMQAGHRNDSAFLFFSFYHTCAIITQAYPMNVLFRAHSDETKAFFSLVVLSGRHEHSTLDKKSRCIKIIYFGKDI